MRSQTIFVIPAWLEVDKCCLRHCFASELSVLTNVSLVHKLSVITHYWHACVSFSEKQMLSAGGRKGIQPVKSWWDADVVMYLGQGADLHMAQLMPLPLTISCFSKSRLVLPSWLCVLPFWCRLTRVVPDKIQQCHKRLCVYQNDIINTFPWCSTNSNDILNKLFRIRRETVIIGNFGYSRSSKQDADGCIWLTEFVFFYWSTVLQGGPKKRTPWLILTITSVNMDRFLLFFHCYNKKFMAHKI